MFKSRHFGKALAVALALAAVGIGAAVATGSFEHNNRQALREAREVAR